MESGIRVFCRVVRCHLDAALQEIRSQESQGQHSLPLYPKQLHGVDNLHNSVTPLVEFVRIYQHLFAEIADKLSNEGSILEAAEKNSSAISRTRLALTSTGVHITDMLGALQLSRSRQVENHSSKYTLLYTNTNKKETGRSVSQISKRTKVYIYD